MKIRWPFVLLFLIACGLVELSWGATSTLLPVEDPATYRDLQNLEQVIVSPSISTGTAQNLTITNLTVNGTVGGTATFGKLFQVVQGTTTSTNSSTSTSYVATALSVVIHPISASNCMWVTTSFTARITDSGASNNNEYQYTLFRNSTDIGPFGIAGALITAGTTLQPQLTHGFSIMDVPATTNALTYTLNMKVEAGTAGYDFNINNLLASIIVMEAPCKS